MHKVTRWLLPLAIAPSLLLAGCPVRTPAEPAPGEAPAALAFALAPVGQEVVMIDLRVNRMAGALAAGGVPSALAVTPQGRLLLVANETTNVIRTYRQQDYALYTYLGDISVGRQPEWIAVNPAKHEALIAVKGDSRVALLDISSRQERPKVKTLIPMAEAPIATAVSHDGALAAAISDKGLYRLTRNGETYTVDAVSLPQAASRRLSGLTFVGDRMAIIDAQNSELLLVSPNGETTTVKLDQGGKADLPAAVVANRQGTKLYVAAPGTNSVAVVTLGTTPGVNHVDLEKAELPAGLAITDDGTRLYVTHKAGLQMAILATSPDPAQPDRLEKTFGLTPSAANQAPLDEIVLP